MINPFRPIARLSRIMPFLLFVLLQTLSAVAVAEGNSTRQYNIPPQPLSSALQAFSDSSHLQLLYDANLVAGLTSPAVKGAYTPQQALAQLLGQSGLSYQIKSARMVTLTKRTGKDSGVNADENLLPVVQVTAKADDNAGGDTTLPKVTVEADSAYDPEYYSDPYNKDYVQPNATVGTKTGTPIMETPLNVQVISKQVLKEQQLYRVEKNADYGDFAPLLNKTADVDIVVEQWESMIHVAQSLKQRTAPAHVIVQRLTNSFPSDRLSKAFTNLGRIIKTEYILRYITDPALRRTVQLQLNKGEYRHKLPRWIFFANQGEFTTGDYEEIMNKASSLSLVSNAILYWNTSRIQNNVEDLRKQGEQVEDKTLSHISLLPYKHVLPNGTYFNDIEVSEG